MPAPSLPAPSEPAPSEPALTLPRSPEPPAPRPFPILATLAPVLVSVLLFVVTRSPFALLFAVLGPVAAVAGLGDTHWQQRRHRKAEETRFARELQRSRELIRAAHTRARARREAHAPSASSLLARGPTDAERWRETPGDPLPVTIGTGTVASGIAWEDPPSASEAEERLLGLREEAAVLGDAPVILDAALGIGIVASGPRGIAVANGILVQLVSRLHPREVEVRASTAAGLGWLGGLPHWAGELSASGGVSRVELRPRRGREALRSQGAGHGGEEAVVLVVAARREELPRDCRVAVAVEAGGRGRILFAPGQPVDGPVSLSFVSEQECAAFARMLGVAARREGVGQGGGRLPQLVRFGELEHSILPPPPGLPAVLGTGPDGAATVDLVADGPHAVVGGTTGTGKSELLTTWILGMAAVASPERFTVLLVDFKGGAAFEPLRALPHCVGVVTDLDARAAERALASLSAELRHRERVLSRAGVRSIQELPTPAEDEGAAGPEPEGRARPDALARLVIVVDEYAALASTAPGLQAVFTDLAARGRSLGIHLILCTQRPAEGIRDSVLANCSLRLSLRVNNRADSEAVVGSAAAAELPRNPPGRAILVRADGGPAAVQLALACPADVAAVAGRWPAVEVRRPWLDPLPAVLEPDALPTASAGPGLVFGLLDLPEEQSREPARYDPDTDGSLLVLGAHRSGKSGLLAALAAAAPEAMPVPGDPEPAWDAVSAALGRLRSGTESAPLLLLDDLDVLTGRFAPEYQQDFLEMLLAVIREGRALGVHCVIAVRQLTTGLHAVAAACEARLLLRLPDAQDHVAAGGERAAFDPALPPGGGHWRGHRLQIVKARAPASPPVPEAEPLELRRHRVSAVVSTAPAAFAARLGGAAGFVRPGPSIRPTEPPSPEPPSPDSTAIGPLAPPSPIPLAEPEEWQSSLTVLAAARAEGAVLFHGCTPAELRMLTGRRALPPPLATAESCWLLGPEGELSRVRLPPQAPRTSASGV